MFDLIICGLFVCQKLLVDILWKNESLLLVSHKQKPPVSMLAVIPGKFPTIWKTLQLERWWPKATVTLDTRH